MERRFGCRQRSWQKYRRRFRCQTDRDRYRRRVSDEAIGRALELCGRFNIVDMNDRTAEVLGGAQKDLSLGLNYYINKHIGIKVNYSYVIPGKHIRKISDKNFSILQARFQFIL